MSPDGSRIFVTGSSIDSRSSYDYATVAYAAASGSQLWVARYNGPASGYDLAYSLAVSPDGSKVFVTGRSSGWGSLAPPSVGDYATVAYAASSGLQLWATHYNGPANLDDVATSLAVSPDGSKVFVTGSSSDSFSTDYATVAYRTTTTCANGADEVGPVSTTMHSAVEPQAGPAAPYVHGINCDVVVANGL